MNIVWASAADFWSMGGYGLYVWGSFGVTALVIAGEIWVLRRARGRLKDELDASDSTPPAESDDQD